MAWVLVFDLDDTLSAIKDEDVRRPDAYNKAILNDTMIEILRAAVSARERGEVSALLLLTNNDNAPYIDGIVKRLEAFVSAPIFDLIARRSDKLRTPYPHPNPQIAAMYALKDYATVERMIETIGKPTENLKSRILFFDDDPLHVLRTELRPSQYIYMKWVNRSKDGKILDLADETDYKSVYEALGYPKNSFSLRGKVFASGQRQEHVYEPGVNPHEWMSGGPNYIFGSAPPQEQRVVIKPHTPPAVPKFNPDDYLAFPDEMTGGKRGAGSNKRSKRGGKRNKRSTGKNKSKSSGRKTWSTRRLRSAKSLNSRHAV